MAFFTHELAIDLGTANTVIFKDDEVVLDEPSIIAVETKTGKLVAIGNEAQLIEEHTNPRIYTVRPLMNGVIADYDAAEMMLNGFIKKAIGKRRSLFKPALKIVIGIPGGGTPQKNNSVGGPRGHLHHLCAAGADGGNQLLQGQHLCQDRYLCHPDR